MLALVEGVTVIVKSGVLEPVTLLRADLVPVGVRVEVIDTGAERVTTGVLVDVLLVRADLVPVEVLVAVTVDRAVLELVPVLVDV